MHIDVAFYVPMAHNGVLRVVENPKTKEQEPEVLDPETLAAIDKVERWEPRTETVAFDQDLDRASARNQT
jgi:hypothetical protein